MDRQGDVQTSSWAESLVIGTYGLVHQMRIHGLVAPVVS